MTGIPAGQVKRELLKLFAKHPDEEDLKRSVEVVLKRLKPGKPGRPKKH
jgi:hypothetical protein